ncbi:hypothetical protein LADH09A_002831 [Micromonospora sp. LAH09]|nr:hypothetical protein [Micromonospora cabrerizensis]MCG5468930.1 hypothetical protein [Micromonospora cabrerizensis]
MYERLRRVSGVVFACPARHVTAWTAGGGHLVEVGAGRQSKGRGSG